MTVSNTQQHHELDDTIDLKELARTLIKHWYWILLCVIVAVALAVLYLRVTKPVYAVDGLIQVESNKNASAALLGDLSSVMDVKSPAQTEIELLKSRFVLGQALKNLKLDIGLSSPQEQLTQRVRQPLPHVLMHSPKHVFYQIDRTYIDLARLDVSEALLDQRLTLTLKGNKTYQISLNEQVLLTGLIGQATHVDTPMGTIDLLVNDASSQGTLFLVKKSLRSAAQDLSSRLSVSEKGKLTGILALSYQGTNPTLITQTLNEIMQVYLKQNVERRSAETQKTLAFLKAQLPELKDELEASERRYNEFRRQNNTIDVTKESELLLMQSVSLKTTRMELEQKAAELKARFTDEYPLMAEVNAQLAELAQENKKLEQRMTQIPEIQRLYLQLFRDVQVNTELYTSLLNSYQQLKVVKASEIGNVRVIDQAVKPMEPIKPKRSLVLMLAVLLGGFAGTALILLKNLLFSGIKDSSLIESRLGLSILATVPRSIMQRKLTRRFRKGQQHLLAAQDSEDMAIESLRSLRTVVHFAASGRNNVILITGPSPSIGKSFIAANFAAVMAQMGKSVVLIDADMRRGHLFNYFELERGVGLSEYLQGKESNLDLLCHKTNIEGLEFLNTGAIPPNPAELLLNERFNTLMDELSSTFDFVILDSPPLLAATDGVIIGRKAGLTLMVARYGHTDIKELEVANNRLVQAGVTVQGVVFNDIQQGAGTGYGYQYGYQYRSNKS
jgi:tyrosine-protein kinase Etk/Wzc